MFFSMKRSLVVFVLLFGAVSCTGTSQNTGANSVEASTAEEPDSAEKGNEKKEEASAAPDTTTTTDQDTTTTTDQDTTTTTSVVGNLCDSCTYLSISELSSKLSEVPKLAWDDSQRILNENTNTDNVDNVEIIINIGPTTELYFLDNESYIQKAINFWQNFNLPEKYYAFFYSYNDLDWAINELTSSGFEGGYARAPCGYEDGICNGAASSIDYRSPHFGVGVFGINSPDSIDAYRYGPIHIHEVTHSVHAAQWIGKAIKIPGCCEFPNNPEIDFRNTSPCWLTEGIANAVGLSIGVDTYEKYLEIRRSQVTSRHIQPPYDDYSASKILNYYNESIPGICIGNPDYVLGYSIGYLTVEAMSAMSGSDSAMRMYSLMVNGQNFEDAFENIYEISWNDAKPIFSEYVSSVIEDLM